jgi:hypothetical protein
MHSVSSRMLHTPPDRGVLKKPRGLRVQQASESGLSLSLSLPLSLPLHFTHPHIPLFFSFFSVVILFFSVSLYSPSSPSSPSPPLLPPPFSSSSSSSLSASSSSSFISSYFFFSSSLLFAMLPCRTTARPDALPVRTDSVRVHACRITKRVLFAGAVVGMWLFGLVV